MRSLNIIGAGRLGKTLGRLWHQQGTFRVQTVCNRTADSTRAAVAFIGAGHGAASLESMDDADCWLIATGDGHIEEVAAALAPRLADKNDTVVFHCSGALSSKVLAPCRPAAIASAHPVHSFADPAQSVRNLAGTSVALEGDAAATSLLGSAFAALQCKLLAIAPENKSLYHAGSVFACNYLSALMDLSLRTFAAAGIEREQALELLSPIVMQTARNNMQLGPEKSLTGPIARGDATTVAAQLEALQQTDPQLAECYRQLGRACVELARRGTLSPDGADALTELLQEPPQ
ncbi:Rossmann-like and DUF2520 domain-containing protein [Microbulbifer hainanensis]|uniref:Rossmann-like and DUF2520 domain-containing protein n=1 Tax=Microbulbifer hainanensis TaxID=2735675 RepID=UPI00186620CC|nr:Rossmann-like and DUF2520 domain-containing protein [Microbulbifer hainanensis]